MRSLVSKDVKITEHMLKTLTKLIGIFTSVYVAFIVIFYVLSYFTLPNEFVFYFIYTLIYLPGFLYLVLFSKSLIRDRNEKTILAYVIVGIVIAILTVWIYKVVTFGYGPGPEVEVPAPANFITL